MDQSGSRLSDKSGLAPGAAVHVGQQFPGEVQVRAATFSRGEYIEHEPQTFDTCPKPSTGEACWIAVVGLADTDLITRIGERFGLHPLIVEDILNTEHRPKLTDMDTYMHVAVQWLHYVESSDMPQPALEREQVSVVLSRAYVLSFEERPSPLFEPVRARLARQDGRVRALGSDYVAYALLDVIVDHYFDLLEQLGELLADAEDEVTNTRSTDALATLHHLRADLITVRRSVWPLREVASRLRETDSPLLDDEMRPYLNDLYDHTLQILDSVETLRDTLASLLDLYLSITSNRLNEIMKVLTVISTLFIPLTFLAGLYGMNFHNMPELSWPWGYPVLLLLMAALFIGMLRYFKRRGWF